MRSLGWRKQYLRNVNMSTAHMPVSPLDTDLARSSAEEADVWQKSRQPSLQSNLHNRRYTLQRPLALELPSNSDRFP